MSSFWTSGTGMIPTGKPEDAFIGNFTIIPDGTQASACIKSFTKVDKENKHTGAVDRFYSVVYKLLDGDYKGNEVTQKIKCFDGKPEQIQRNLNMLKLVMELCEFKPTSDKAPDDIDLLPMVNKILCVKIREWSMPKADGSGFLEGNFVSEVWASGALPTESGVKAAVTHQPTQSALQRNAGVPAIPDDGIPY